MEQIDEYGRHGELVARYTKGRLLGKGGFAKCYEATNVETQEKFAVKVVCKSSLKTKTRQKLKTEIKIHRSLSHRHIVKFHRYFEDSRNVYILLELCRGQTLMEQSTRKGRFTEEETAYVVYQSLLSLEHMHAEGVIHRDLKLSNIMLTADNEIKIGDFGLAAKVSSGEKRRTLCGTPNYIAPEILESGHTHSFEVDVWTVGIIMYAMLCGKPPFQTHDVKMTYGKIKRCSYTFPSNVAISSEARSLIQRILQVSPGLRPTVREMMADPWFRLHKPGKLAPLSLFVPGSAAHHSQHLRLVEERRNAAAAAAAAGADGAEPAAAAAAPAAAEGRGRDFKPRREPLGTVDGNREHLRAGSSSKRAFDVYCEPAAVYRRADSARGQRTASSASASASASAAAAHHHQQRAEQRDAGTGGAGFFRSASAVCKPVSASKAAPLAPSASSPLRLYNSSPRNSREIGAASPQARAAAAMAAAASAAAASSSSGGRADMSPAHERLHNTKRSPSEPASYRDVRGLRTGSVPASRSGSRDRVVDRHSSPRPRGVRSRLSSTGSAPSAAVPLRSQSQSPSPSAAAAAAAEQHQQQPRASASPRPASQPTAAAPAPAPAPSLAPAAPAEDEDLTRLHHKLEETLALVGDDADAKADNAPPAHLAPAIWVTECTDFTANYGLAYRLSNGQIGVHFNDNSKMTYDTATGDIWYVERLRGAQQQQARSSGSSGSREALSKHHVESYPDTLNKKVTLVKYFSTYILRFAGRTPKPGQQEVVTCSTAPREGFASVANPPEGTEAEEASGAGLVYVRKWLKTADATIFRLSNRTVQVAFHDKTEVILSSEAKLVTYTDKKGERTTFSLSSMTYTQPDIANRLRHTKDIIGQLIHVNGRA